jgi:uncharacterized membrane-anchored protein
VAAAFVVEVPTGCGFAVELFREGIVEFEGREAGKVDWGGGLTRIERQPYFSSIYTWGGCDQRTSFSKLC